MISLALLAVNLGLAGTLIFFITTQKTSFTPLIQTKYHTNTVTQIAVRKINATNSFLSALGNRPLSWQALESTNYIAYMENLAAFGCPDETIRDIILTDICKLYAKRRAQIRAQAPQPKYWQTGDPNSTLTPELRRQLRELEQEQDTLIRELLGVNFRTELAKYWSEDEPTELNVSFLPKEKQQAVQAVHEKYAELENEVYLRMQGLYLDEDEAALQRIQKQREAELAQVLSPEELEAYQLRNSETAQNLRTQLTGFQPTEEEFRAIFKLQKTFDDQFSKAFDPTDDAALAIRTRAQAEAAEALNNEISKTLGPERFGEYQRAQDGDYRNLVQVADRFNLPREVASSVYEMKVAAEQQKAQVEANANLSEEQRGAMLAAIARTTEQSVASALGTNVYRSYQRSAGQWLANLSIVNEDNLAIPPEQPQITPEMLRQYLNIPPNILLPPLPPPPPAR